MNIGIVLAGGKGKRFKTTLFNKTSVEFGGKPLVKYGTDLFSQVADKTIVIVGLQSESVIEALKGDSKIYFALQKVRLGTGHAVKIAVEKIKEKGWKPEKVWVGYGDHMMFYTPEIIVQLSYELDEKDKVISLLTCDYENPDSLAWGRIIRDKSGNVSGIVEQKDANQEERKIKELNAGLYCFRYNFIVEGLKRIKKSPVSGEYYLTDLIKIAKDMGYKVVPVNVSFDYIGIGINTHEELKTSLNLFRKRSNLK